MPPHIRPMNWRTDRVAVLGFQKEVYETNFAGFAVTVGFLRDYDSQLRQAARSRAEQVLVLDDEGAVRGFVWMAVLTTMADPLVGYIKNIYVEPQLRGQGWGQRMLEEADRWFLEHGCPKAALDATIANSRAVRTYLGAGYEPVRYRMEKVYGLATPRAEDAGDES